MSAWSAFRFFPLSSQRTGLVSLIFNGQTVAVAIGSEAEWEAKRVVEAEGGEIDELAAAKDAIVLGPF